MEQVNTEWHTQYLASSIQGLGHHLPAHYRVHSYTPIEWTGRNTM